MKIANVSHLVKSLNCPSYSYIKDGFVELQSAFDLSFVQVSKKCLNINSILVYVMYIYKFCTVCHCKLKICYKLPALIERLYVYTGSVRHLYHLTWIAQWSSVCLHLFNLLC